MKKFLFFIPVILLIVATTITKNSTKKLDKEIFEIAKNRAEKHALNTLELLKDKTALTPYAGQGRRQGKEHEGPVKL